MSSACQFRFDKIRKVTLLYGTILTKNKAKKITSAPKKKAIVTRTVT